MADGFLKGLLDKGNRGLQKALLATAIFTATEAMPMRAEAQPSPGEISKLDRPADVKVTLKDGKLTFPASATEIGFSKVNDNGTERLIGHYHKDGNPHDYKFLIEEDGKPGEVKSISAKGAAVKAFGLHNLPEGLTFDKNVTPVLDRNGLKATIPAGGTVILSTAQNPSKAGLVEDAKFFKALKITKTDDGGFKISDGDKTEIMIPNGGIIKTSAGERMIPSVRVFKMLSDEEIKKYKEDPKINDAQKQYELNIKLPKDQDKLEKDFYILIESAAKLALILSSKSRVSADELKNEKPFSFAERIVLNRHKNPEQEKT